MSRAVVAVALLVVAASAFARSSQGGTKIQQNLCGYSNATGFMDLAREKWFSIELGKLMPEQQAAMMAELEKVSPKAKALQEDDTTTVIPIPRLHEHLLLLRDGAAKVTGEKAKIAQQVVAHLDKIIAKINA